MLNDKQVGVLFGFICSAVKKEKEIPNTLGMAVGDLLFNTTEGMFAYDEAKKKEFIEAAHSQIKQWLSYYPIPS